MYVAKSVVLLVLFPVVVFPQLANEVLFRQNLNQIRTLGKCGPPRVRLVYAGPSLVDFFKLIFNENVFTGQLWQKCVVGLNFGRDIGSANFANQFANLVIFIVKLLADYLID